MGKTTRRIAGAVAGSALLCLGLAAAPASASPGQTTTDLSTATATDLANSLTGGGLSVSNATSSGQPVQAGTFSGLGAVGFGSGVVLSTGDVADIVGPNQADNTTTRFGGAGDGDVAAITGTVTEDASVLEFDFVPTTAAIQFQYVFGSEEYNEYIGSYNDGFVFLVNGVNCAVVGADPVSVNSISGVTNAGLFRNNDPTDGPSGIDIEADGLTTVLTCSATVNPNVINHVKLAIADAVDDSLDSTVYIAAGSFQANRPPVSVNDAYTTTPGTTLNVVAPGVLANDTDPDGDALQATLLTPTSDGTLVANADGSFSYTPDAGFTGTDTFIYIVSDGALSSNIATVTISVTAAVITPPIITPPPPPTSPSTTSSTTTAPTTTTTPTTSTEPSTSTEPELPIGDTVPPPAADGPSVTPGSPSGGVIYSPAPSGGAQGQGLARTGSNSGPLLLLGISLLTVGAAMLGIRRRQSAARAS